jgi:phosphopantetheinyl transferase
MNEILLPETWRGRAIVIREGDVPAGWFSEEELAEVEAVVRAKRRAEWLLSRAAAKTLAVRLGLAPDPASCRIGQRRIASSHLSLSHSAPYAAAAIDARQIGIDVQVIRPLDERAAHLFLGDDETSAMQTCTLADRLIHFWSAKEAAWKRLGGSVETLKKVPLVLVAEANDGLTFDSVETRRIGDLVIALTR